MAWFVTGLLMAWFLRARAEWRRWVGIANAEVDRVRAEQPNMHWLKVADEALGRIEVWAGDAFPVMLVNVVEKRAKGGRP